MNSFVQSLNDRPLRAAILGSGNVGTDLLCKVRRNSKLELKLFAGIDPNSEGLAELGVTTSVDGVDAGLGAGLN